MQQRGNLRASSKLPFSFIKETNRSFLLLLLLPLRDQTIPSDLLPTWNECNIRTGCENTNSCEQCQGWCKTDANCRGPMVCYKREFNRFMPLGCAGTPDDQVDYCVLPGDGIGYYPPNREKDPQAIGCADDPGGCPICRGECP